jgi:thiol:disulfide interchange protein DsbA
MTRIVAALALAGWAMLFAQGNGVTAVAAADSHAIAPVAGTQTERWLAGRDYVVVEPASPWRAQAGTIEVVEMFSYTCSGCYQFEPYVQKWRATLPASVRFTRLPAAWDERGRAYGRLYFVLKALKREDLDDAVFEVAHGNRDALFVAGNERATFAAQAAFAKAHGISESAFKQAYESRDVLAECNRATEMAVQYRVEHTPAMVVNGRYTTDARRLYFSPNAKHEEQALETLLHWTDEMIAKERAHPTLAQSRSASEVRP